MLTTTEIDAQMVAAHWRMSHAGWIDNTIDEKNALVEMDALLEQRFQLRFPAGEGRADDDGSNTAVSA